MKILVVCGGGVFGLVPAYLIGMTEGTNTLDKWDAFGGTSVGSEIVLGYATGCSASNMLETFSTDMYKIFETSFLKSLNPFGPKYKDTALNKALKALIPGLLGDIEKPVFVPAFDFRANIPKVFDTLDKNFDGMNLAWEIARMSSAAPTYFNPYRGYIDGGLVANNPALLTVWGLNKKLGIPYEEMEVLVLGTAQNAINSTIDSRVGYWTKLHWVTPLISTFILGNESVAHFGMQQLPLKRYHYFPGVQMKDTWKIDDPYLEDQMLEEAERVLNRFSEIYEQF
jgi:patatin-like phospholipase/acyl hydrolase